MSAHLDFECFPKKDEFIISYNGCLDIYEVMADKIYPHRLEDYSCHVPHGLSSLYYCLANRNTCYDFQLFDEDILFNYLMPNGMTGSGMRQKEGDHITIMFGPKLLKDSLPKLLNLTQYYRKHYENLNDPPFRFNDWEEECLQSMINGVNKVEELDGLISLAYG